MRSCEFITENPLSLINLGLRRGLKAADSLSGVGKKYFKWTAGTEKQLANLWAEGKSIAEIADELGLHQKAVQAKARRLGLPSRIRRTSPWTADRIEELAKLWRAGAEVDDIAQHFGVSRSAVISKVAYIRKSMNLPNRTAWSNERLELLKKLWYEDLTLKQIADELGISSVWVASKARGLGLPPPMERHAWVTGLYQKGPRKWTDDKIDELKKLWLEGKPIDEIAAHFGISVRGLQGIIQILKRKGNWDLPMRNRGRKGPSKWTAEKNKEFEKLWAEGKSIAEIADELGIPSGSVTSKARGLGLPTRNIKWTDDKIEELKTLWRENKTLDEIAEYFRTKKANITTAIQIQKRKGNWDLPMFRTWSDERVELLKKLWSEGQSISQIGKELGVPKRAVENKVRRLGLPLRKKWTDDNIEELKTLWREEKTVDEIAAYFKTHARSVYKVIANLKRKGNWDLPMRNRGRKKGSETKSSGPAQQQTR